MAFKILTSTAIALSLFAGAASAEEAKTPPKAITLEGCSTVEVTSQKQSVAGGERYLSTVTCYGDSNFPRVKQLDVTSGVGVCCTLNGIVVH